MPIGTVTVKLPKPTGKSATSLEEALRGRSAGRTFGTAPLPLAEAMALDLGCGTMVEFEVPKLAKALRIGPDEKPFTVLVVTRPEPGPRQ